MPLTLDQAAEMLGVTAETMRRWARQGLLGARLPSGELRFEEAELRRWALRHGLQPRAPGTGPGRTAGGDEETAAGPLLAALRRGGVVGELPGGPAAEVLARLVERAPLAEGVDRARLLDELLAREALSSTALGGGVAMPHPRHPSPAFAARPRVCVAWLRPPADWRALDGQPVHTAFLLVSPGPREHLQVLSHLAFLFRDPAFCAFLAGPPSAEALLAEIEAREPRAGG